MLKSDDVTRCEEITTYGDNDAMIRRQKIVHFSGIKTLQKPSVAHYVFPPFCPPVCPPTFPPGCSLSVYLSVFLSVHLSVYTCIFTFCSLVCHLSHHLFDHLFVHLSAFAVCLMCLSLSSPVRF